MRLRDSVDSADPGVQDSQGEVLIDFSRVRLAFRRQRSVLAAWIGVFVLLGLLFLVTTPPGYRASATVLLTGEASSQVDELGVTGTVTDASAETAQQIFRSQALALRVTDMLELDKDPAYLDQPLSLARRVLGRVTGTVGGVLDRLAPSPPAEGASVGREGTAEERRRQTVARSLQQKLVLGRIGRSTALQLEIELYDPALAARIVNAYTSAYTSDQLATTFEATARTTEWLQQRLSELEADARQAAMEAELFRAESGLVGTGGTLMTEDNLGLFNAELSEAQAEAARSRALVDSYDAALARGVEALTAVNDQRLSLPGDARLAAMEQTLSSLVARRAEITRNFGSSHPQIAQLDVQIGGAGQRLYSEMERQADAARGEREVAEARVMSLRDALSPLVDENSEAQRARIEYRLLEQRAESLGRLYETFLIQFQETNQLSLYPGSLIRVLTPAEVPRDASSPSAKRVLALTLLLGLIAGIAHAALREAREDYLRTAEDVVGDLGLRFLGYLPTLNRRDLRPDLAGGDTGTSNKASPERQFATDRAGNTAPPQKGFPFAHIVAPRSRYSETLRTIRNASAYSSANRSGTILGVTSILPGEGKTTVATDLAGVMAGEDEPVLLVDGNPRNMGLSRMLGLGPDSDLAQALVGRACRPTRIGANVDALGWSGVAAGHPAEILTSSRMRDIILRASEEYSHVIVDLSPLGPIADARAMVSSVDQIVMVSRWGKTPRAMMRQTLQQEPEISARLIGVVFSNVDMDRLREFAGPKQSETYEAAYSSYFD